MSSDVPLRLLCLLALAGGCDAEDPETTALVVGPEVCGNGADDDLDGLPDCYDPDCDGSCAEVCADGRDNDGNGAVDCADAACVGQCLEVCNDGIDNDADGATDCDDADCTSACPEDCSDGWDNDADGALDCDDADCATTCDADGDGHIALSHGGDDCDDAEASVHPGAVEICDERDNDCDGAVDHADIDISSVTLQAYRFDEDGDGFGSTSGPELLLCWAVPGVSAAFGDCRDNDPSVHPAAPEVCNGIDDDCDDLIDDDDDDLETATADLWYPDADADGLGDDALLTLACESPEPVGWWLHHGGDCDDSNADLGEPAPWVPDGDGDGFGLGAPSAPSCTPPDPLWALAALPRDCDDADATSFPGAPETCEDGVDQDCNTFDPSCTFAISGLVALDAAGTDGALLGDQPGDAAGTALAVVADISGDAVPDLVVGAPDAGTGGLAYVVPGPLAPAVLPLSLAPAAFVGAVPGGGLGSAIAGGLDLSGDGAADVAVAAPDATGTGAFQGVVYVFEGPVGSGAVGVASAHATLWGAVPSSGAGASVAVDDFDDDGDGDLLIGAPGLTSAYLVRGPIPAGTASLSAASERWFGAPSAGTAVASAGDTDGDGVTDLLIGAPNDNTAFLVLGPGAGSQLDLADTRLHGAALGDAAGAAVWGGDLDADGYADLLVGAPGFGPDGGRVYLLPGPVAPGDVDLAHAIDQIGSAADQRIGSAVTAADLDGDGALDPIVGAPGLGAGTVLVLYGPLVGVRGPETADAVLTGSAGDAVGRGALETGDADGDGAMDLLVGAPGAGDEGAAWLLLGGR